MVKGILGVQTTAHMYIYGDSFLAPDKRWPPWP